MAEAGLPDEWLLVNFGDEFSGIAFVDLQRLAASGARVCAQLRMHHQVQVHLVLVLPCEDAPFELVDIKRRRKGWALTAQIGWRAVLGHDEAETDWRVLLHVTSALLAANQERGLPLPALPPIH